MNRKLFAALLTTVLCTALALHAQEAPEMPEMPKPQVEHEWLQQLVGDWDTETTVYMDPDTTMSGKSSESVRSLGGFWIVSEGRGSMDGMPGEMESVLTMGYDADKKKYVGTWVDSMSGYMWRYTGTLDASGNKLTLDTEGPCPMRGGAMTPFREELEIKSPDHRVFTSYMQTESGEWQKIVQMESRRKK